MFHGSLELKVKKLYLIIAAAVIVIAAIVITLWQLGILSKWSAKIWAAQAVVIVKEVQTEKVIVDAEVIISGQKAKTDSSGKVNISTLRAGKTDLKISRKPYKYFSQKIKLHRGKNDLGTIHLSLVEATVSGKVINYISEDTISNATVTIEDISAQTNDVGDFVLTKVPGGEYDMKIEKDGFNTAVQKVQIDNEKIDLQNVKIVPEGKVVFVSNRDGKRGIYQANYDGTDQKFLVDRIGDFEDYEPELSPHQTKVSFLSTRDGAYDANSHLIAKLYVVNINGSKMKEISGDPGIYNSFWSPDGGYILYRSKKDGEKNSAIRVYNVLNEETYTINDPQSNATAGSFIISPNDNKIVYSLSNSSWGSNDTGLYLADIDGNNKTKIYDKPSSPINFSEDGSVINFSDTSNNYKKLSYNLSNGQIQDANIASNETIRGVKSPNQSKVAFVDNRDGKANVYVADTDYTNEKVLTDINSCYGPVEWSKDGQYVMFNVSKTGENARYIVSINGNLKAKKVVDVYGGGM